MENQLTLGTKEYFRWECTNLREMWGYKKFWKNPEHALNAFGGLLVVWLKTKNPEECDKILMQTMKDEFERRFSLVPFILNGERNGTGLEQG